MKTANAFRRGKFVLIHAHCATPDWIRFACAPFLKLHESEPDERLGEALRTALAAFRSGVPHPGSTALEELLGAAGVKSWSTFTRNARLVSAGSDADFIELSPCHNRGSRQGFVEDEQASKLPLGCTASELGRELRTLDEMAT